MAIVDVTFNITPAAKRKKKILGVPVYPGTFAIVDPNNPKIELDSGNLVVRGKGDIKFQFPNAHGYTPLYPVFQKTHGRGDSDGEINMPKAEHVISINPPSIQITDHFLLRGKKKRRVHVWKVMFWMLGPNRKYAIVDPEIENTEQNRGD